jgi:uncharacterized protein YoaH (UPF0181 family)
MEKVKELIARGATLSEAIRIVTGLSLRALTDKHKRSYSPFANVLAGRLGPAPRDIEILLAELGGTPFEWRMLLWEAGRPKREDSVALSA